MRGLGSRRKPRTDEGASAVEFALVVPLLVALLFGIISYGYMFSVRQAVTQAAAEGARAGAVLPAGQDVSAAAIDAVSQALDSYDVVCGDGTLHCAATVGDCDGATSAQCVTVEVRLDYDKIDPVHLMPTPDELEFVSTAEIN